MARSTGGEDQTSSSASGTARVFREDVRFNGVKVFSATMVADRTQLGEKVTQWIAAHPTFKISEIVTTQSSDDQFHCIALSVFYWEPLARR